MIDNNIIQSLGAGSGIDTTSLVNQLTAIERSAPQTRIDTSRELNESKISDYGLLKSSMATLQDAANVLAGDEALFSKSASFTESTALVPSNITTDVQPGIYNIEVLEIAQAQSLAFAGFADPTDVVGEGTLTINFGSWARDGSDLPTGFTLDADSESLVIDITGANNSLNGLRDTINAADAGVQASIIFDGSDYRLSLLADSGAANQIEITVEETAGGAADTDDVGLSRFAFNTNITDFTDLENQLGQDAELKVNGLTVYRESNTIDDVVSGLTIDVLKKAPGEKVTITVTDDVDFAKTSVRDFVEAYNTFLDAISDLSGYKEVEDDDGNTETVAGSLQNDSLTKSILTKIRSLLGSTVPGLADSNFTSLTNIGIRTELDGTLSIDDTDFDKGFSDYFEDVQKMFGPRHVSDTDDIKVNSFGTNTLPGVYDVQVTTPPRQGYINGAAIDGGAVTFPDFDSTSKDYSFKIKIDGTESATITIPEGVYASQDDMAAAMQSLINSDATIKAASERVSVAYDTDNDRFVFTSSSYGVSSQVNITEASQELSDDLGLGVANGVAGAKASGTVNGVAGFGSANVLLPKLGEPGEGLAMIIGENATSGTVNFSRGFAGELEFLLSEYLESGGLISQRETNIERELNELDDDEEALDTRMTAYEDRLIQQYIAMESIINGLSSTGSFLDSLIDTLPFTSGNS